MQNLIFLSLFLFVVSCGGGGGSSSSTGDSPETTTSEIPGNPLERVELIAPDGKSVQTSLAYTSSDQTQGLQYVREAEFKDDQGLLFFYLEDSARTFWMPNTYFNLDIIYLDRNLKIIEIVWNMPHYTGNIDSEIPRAPTTTSRHVLEMKAGSPISSSLAVGDVLRWKSSLTLDETEDRIQDELNR